MSVLSQELIFMACGSVALVIHLHAGLIPFNMTHIVPQFHVLPHIVVRSATGIS